MAGAESCGGFLLGGFLLGGFLLAAGHDVADLVLAQARDLFWPLIDGLPRDAESIGKFSDPTENGNGF